MSIPRIVAGIAIFVALPLGAWAQPQSALPVLDDKPVAQVDPGGPSAAVTCLAFSADGETLYAAGLDKVVRVWTQKDGRFQLKREFRVPIGPDNAGAINAIALSPDGAWLAMAGRGPIRGEVGFRESGVFVESSVLTAEQRMDAGLIYVANTANPAGGKVLRGHRGGVRTLAFLPPGQGKSPLLVSAAIEPDNAGKSVGTVRLWDAAAGKMLGFCSNLPAYETRPALVGWHTGPQPEQVRVAIAWPERDVKSPSYLRLWDASNKEKPLQGWANDPFTSSAILLGAGNGARLLTGGLAKTDRGYGPGRLQTWNLSADREASAGFGAEISFPQREGLDFLPVGLASVPGAGAAPSYAAVVLRPSDQTRSDRLALIDLTAGRSVADFEIKNPVGNQLPVIAASRRFVAVADTRDHAIHVHAVSDLLAAKGEPAEVLGADSLTPTQVAFVNRGHGLRLTVAGHASPLIFDLDKSRIVADDGTAVTDPPGAGQSLKIAEGGKVVIVPRGNDEPLQVRLPGRLETATFAALRPPAAGRPGVLAIAFTDYASYRTHIMLCDPTTGKPFRLLVSHLQNVRWLAFSASRPLLASIADDQTICIWSLADIDQAVGQIDGLEVGDEGGRVVVRVVKPESAAAKAGLAANDVLDGIGTPQGRSTPIKSAAGLLLAIATHKPGSQIVLSVKTKGQLQVPVDRGVDERKPLFSLMLLRTGKLPDWIGWSPAGPYDFSSPNAEKRLGWHTNTGDPAAPVSFVSARAYSEKYYRQGIIHHLANEADLSRALEQWDKEHPKVMPQPALHFRRPDGALATDNADEFLVHTPVSVLGVGINSDYVSNEPQDLNYVIARTDHGQMHEAETQLRGKAERDGNQWKISLSGVAWRRGVYQLTVELFSKSGGPALARATVTLRFQPPAPVVRWRQDGEAIQTSETAPLQVMSEKVKLEVALQTSEKQQVEVSFVHQRNGQVQNDAPAVLTRTGGGQLTRDFKLVEGLNRFVVQVVNKGALAGHEDDETAIDEIWISYKPPRELPPRFTRLELAGNAELKRIDGKQVWVLNDPSAVFQGKIEASGPLVRAGWSAGGKPESVLPAAESRQIDFTAKLNNLKVGKVSKVQFWAKSKFSDENSAERWLVYHPPLPSYTLDPWKSDDPVVDEVTLTGSVHAATADPFEISVRVISPKGEVREYKADVDRKTEKWKAAIKLFPGGNTIETVAINKWRRESPVGNLMALHFRRPPRIIASPEKVEAKETKKLRLDLKVQGPTGLPLREIRVNGARTEYLVHELATKGDQWTWNLELPEVFVNDGARDLTQLKIQAVTDDGASPEAVVRVVHLKAPQLPSARFLAPAVEATSRHPTFAVTYRVESKKPLERVQILGGKAPVEIVLKKVAKENQQFILQGETSVPLNNGLNNLELVAVNSDGRSPGAKVVIGYVEPAVLILPEKIELRSAKNELERELTPSFKPNGDLEFRQPADRSLVWLSGFVRWSDPQADALDDPSLKVVATVRDCRQFPVSLEPRGKGSEANMRRFRVPMVLINDENQVRIEIPSVGQQSMSHREFNLACSNPIRRQRLHLLVIGVRVQDAANLKKRVLDALSVDPKIRPPQLQGEFVKNPPFERCILYRVLAGEVTRGNVEAQLDRINEEIELSRKRGELLNDVVLIYYQGEDVVVPGTKERWLKTSQNFRHVHMPVQRSGISCQALLRDAGAQLLMVNVAGAYDPRLAGPDWGGDAGMGFMRYAYPNPNEVSDPSPALLGMFNEATRQKRSLGEVVDYVNGLYVRTVSSLRPLTLLDDDQKARQIGGPHDGNGR